MLDPRELETYLILQEATDKYKISAEVLAQLVESGKIRAVRLDGTIAVAEGDVREATKHQSQRESIRASVAYLDGQPIGIGEAARKYGLTAQSVSRWARAGYIRILGREGQKVLLNEADVAYVKAIAMRAGGVRQGKAVFTPDFVPDYARS